jgi:hypothetical protein
MNVPLNSIRLAPASSTNCSYVTFSIPPYAHFKHNLIIEFCTTVSVAFGLSISDLTIAAPKYEWPNSTLVWTSPQYLSAIRSFGNGLTAFPDQLVTGHVLPATYLVDITALYASIVLTCYRIAIEMGSEN